MDSGWDQGPFEQTGPPENHPRAEMMVSLTKNTGHVQYSEQSLLKHRLECNSITTITLISTKV